MSTDLHRARYAQIQLAMQAQGVDALLVAGNAWRSDYLRYAVDVTPMEGEAFALITRDAAAQLWVQHPTEAQRLRAECGHLVVHHSANHHAAVLLAAQQLGQVRWGAAPAAALPWGLAQGPWETSLAATTAWLDHLMVHKLPAEADAVERAARLADELARPGAVGVLGPSATPLPPAVVRLPAPDPYDAAAVASVLYARLREADERGLRVLLVVPPAGDGIGAAVLDRLVRAATGSAPGSAHRP